MKPNYVDVVTPDWYRGHDPLLVERELYLLNFCPTCKDNGKKSPLEGNTRLWRGKGYCPVCERTWTLQAEKVVKPQPEVG